MFPSRIRYEYELIEELIDQRIEYTFPENQIPCKCNIPVGQMPTTMPAEKLLKQYGVLDDKDRDTSYQVN